MVSQQRLVNPIAAQDWTGSRRARLFRQRRGHTQNASATKIAKPFYPLPVVVGWRLHPIELGQLLIHERVIRVEQREDRAIMLKEVGPELHGFLIHDRP